MIDQPKPSPLQWPPPLRDPEPVHSVDYRVSEATLVGDALDVTFSAYECNAQGTEAYAGGSWSTTVRCEARHGHGEKCLTALLPAARKDLERQRDEERRARAPRKAFTELVGLVVHREPEVGPGK